MADLSTTYIGLALKNPVVVGSSDLTMSVERVRECEEAGAGAVVLKSLFEEQIENEIRQARNQASYLMQTAGEIENNYVRIVQSVREKVSNPISVKIGSYFSSLPHTARALEERRRRCPCSV